MITKDTSIFVERGMNQLEHVVKEAVDSLKVEGDDEKQLLKYGKLGLLTALIEVEEMMPLEDYARKRIQDFIELFKKEKQLISTAQEKPVSSYNLVYDFFYIQNLID